MGRTAKGGAVLGFVVGLVALAAVFAIVVQCLPFRISFPPPPWPWYCSDPTYSFIRYLAFPVNLLTNDLSRAVYFAPLSLLLYVILGALIGSRLTSSGSSSQLYTLRWQFRLTWRLAADVHLPALTDDACLWEPAPGSWTVRQSTDGKWRPDWVEPEPDPAPPVTIGWLTWHLIWWWSGLLAVVRNETPAAHHEVAWPGSADAVVRRLETLSTDWANELSRLEDRDLERPLAYPWAEPRPLRLALAWANSELMKNIAEIGYVRHLFEASRDAAQSPSPVDG